MRKGIIIMQGPVGSGVTGKLRTIEREERMRGRSVAALANPTLNLIKMSAERNDVVIIDEADEEMIDFVVDILMPDFPEVLFAVGKHIKTEG